MADSNSYSLLDVNRQLKIPLMNISSLNQSPPPGELGQAQSIEADAGGGISRSASSAQSRPTAAAQSHNRSTSLGGSILVNTPRQERRSGEGRETQSGVSSPPAQTASPQPSSQAIASPPPGDKPLPEAPSGRLTPSQGHQPRSQLGSVFLKPHVVSPASDEFLIVTGTSPLERGIGMFVNLDGDPPTRPTLEFERYPKDLAVDGAASGMASSREQLSDAEVGYVLASMAKEFKDGLRHGLEIQQWDIAGDIEPTKYWLEAEETDVSGAYGLCSLAGNTETSLEGIVERLCERRFVPFAGSAEGSTFSLKSSDSRTALSIERMSKEKELFERDYDSQDDDSLPDGWEAARISEGEEFARQFAKTNARLAVWSVGRVWWALRNPLLSRLDAGLEAARVDGKIDRRAILAVLAPIRGRDGQSDVLQFLSLGFIRQKAGVLLLISLRLSSEKDQFSDQEMAALEEVLMESKLDPRVVLALVPGLRNEIIEGRQGIWIYGGVKNTAEEYLQSEDFDKRGDHEILSLGPRMLHFLRRFLSSWRRMKGFGSVRDEKEVFRTVDAALLLVLLELDRPTSTGMGRSGADVREELDDLADKGVDCFDRAADLLESHHRLFVLSRLYQSRKMAADVLATWRRIIEGERDDGQEFRDGEQRVRKYLRKISEQSLVQEYGVWLAIRNPRLGVQVFAEDREAASKFEPAQVVEVLRAEAPNAVKYYLEHLVFGKGHTAYVNDLIAYYLDIVIGDLQASAESRETVMATYDSYRALQTPKPSYSHFLTDNAPADDEVWQSRLRLLQLLGGDHGYDVSGIWKRIASLPGELLVAETIILAGRERHHEDALRLLVHKLGDYDTAVSYCLRGGSSIYTPRTGHRDSLPSIDQQRLLFHAVLRAFLTIEDVSDRVEQSGSLLERFGGWFEIDEVLGLIPDDWSVDVVAGFLVGALRRLVADRHRSMLKSALSGAENLRVSYDVVVKMDEKGPSIEAPN